MTLSNVFLSGLRNKVSLRCAAAVGAAVFAVASAHAASVVTDGGFESAGGGNIYFTGQTIDGGSWAVSRGVVYIDTIDPYVYAGSNSANLTYANLYAPNSLSQTVATVVGQVYAVNFWADADAANTFSFTENGTVIGGTPSSIAANGFPNTSNSALFTDYTGAFQATSAATVLNLTATANPAIGSANGSVVVDNVNVQSSAVTPEPGSLGLLLTGVAGVSAAVRRRRRPSGVAAC